MTKTYIQINIYNNKENLYIYISKISKNKKLKQSHINIFRKICYYVVKRWWSSSSWNTLLVHGGSITSFKCVSLILTFIFKHVVFSTVGLSTKRPFTYYLCIMLLYLCHLLSTLCEPIWFQYTFMRRLCMFFCYRLIMPLDACRSRCYSQLSYSYIQCCSASTRDRTTNVSSAALEKISTNGLSIVIDFIALYINQFSIDVHRCRSNRGP